MTIYQLKALNEKNGGLFFSRNTMKFFGDTMKRFGVKRINDNQVKVYRKWGRKAEWFFDAETGRALRGPLNDLV